MVSGTMEDGVGIFLWIEEKMLFPLYPAVNR